MEFVHADIMKAEAHRKTKTLFACNMSEWITCSKGNKKGTNYVSVNYCNSTETFRLERAKIGKNENPTA